MTEPDAPDPRVIPSYHAERFLRPGHLFGSVTEVQARVDACVTSLEWQAITRRPATPVKVSARRFRSGFYAARANTRTGVLSLADTGHTWDERLILHELAHFAAPVTGHGPPWRQVYARVLAAFTHAPHAVALGYDPGTEQAERWLIGCARGRLRLPKGYAPVLPDDLTPALAPDLTDSQVADALDVAYSARAAATLASQDTPDWWHNRG